MISAAVVTKILFLFARGHGCFSGQAQNGGQQPGLACNDLSPAEVGKGNSVSYSNEPIEPGRRVVGTVATLVCPDGFDVNGNLMRVCTTDGTYSDSFGPCEPICSVGATGNGNLEITFNDEAGTPAAAPFADTFVTANCDDGSMIFCVCTPDLMFIALDGNDAQCLADPLCS